MFFIGILFGAYLNIHFNNYFGLENKEIFLFIFAKRQPTNVLLFSIILTAQRATGVNLVSRMI